MSISLRFLLGQALIIGLIGCCITRADAAGAAPIPPGTKITTANWRQYQQFMPDGMVALFQGGQSWKMPDDVEIDVGPTIIHPLPKGYAEATEKYAEQVRLQSLDGGAHTLIGYVAGAPFPNPSGPDAGWEILADNWFRYAPHLTVSTPEHPISECTQDGFGNISCEQEMYVDRYLSHVTDPGVPMTDAAADGRFETRFGMVLAPEQRKYTTTLSIFFDDLTKLPASYIFTPAERRVMQLSAGARCQSSGGSDMTADDYRYGFAGAIPYFSAKLLGERKILALLNYASPGGIFPTNYDMPLGFPKPSWGKWEVRDAYIIDVRKIPSQAEGYCYGRRVMYIDKRFYGTLWLDLYDRNMRLWKVAHISPQAMEVPGIGIVNNAGSFSEQFWDLINHHGTYDASFDATGHTVLVNSQAPPEYNDIQKYSSPNGLSEVMR